MMQPELLRPAWHSYKIMDSISDQVGAYGLHGDGHIVDSEFSFSSSFTTSDSSGISSDPFYPTMFTDEFIKLPILNDELQVMFSTENIAHDMEGFEPILGGEIGDICSWLGESEGEGSHPSQQLPIEGDDVWSPSISMKSSEASTVFSSVNLSPPGDDMEIDNQLSIHHLLQAYAEAMEMEQRELAEVIVKSISEKVSPVGEPLERLAFYLFESTEKEGDYLKQESSKNFEAAFMAFYQIFPYGSRQQKAVRLTSIKSWEEDYCCTPPQWRFEETKRHLYNHAKSFGLKLKVEEMGIEDLASEIKSMKKRGGGREWLAFNCMVGLPHMQRSRRSHAVEFLRVAKELLANSATNGGFIAFGDGDAAEEKLRNCSGYGSFFYGYLTHYLALHESMDWNFPNYLAEARLIMESLFVAPYVSSVSWLQKWEEIRGSSDLQVGVGLESCRMSIANLMEAIEIVKGGENSYEVKTEGQNENEMVLEWRGTPLVRVSTWR
ncbi:hypothetical protein F0562_015207 [Nyssa sinensis]|uniref:Uncharacterized protein n=1 Tax=Nyssa sinensis TaxID=561372 RepID=A0A5J4ZIT4_9ASTE|nr:hypothetical protein F0562_015207 [Nyssa sinensis]